MHYCRWFIFSGVIISNYTGIYRYIRILLIFPDLVIQEMSRQWKAGAIPESHRLTVYQSDFMPEHIGSTTDRTAKYTAWHVKNAVHRIPVAMNFAVDYSVNINKQNDTGRRENETANENRQVDTTLSIVCDRIDVCQRTNVDPKLESIGCATTGDASTSSGDVDHRVATSCRYSQAHEFDGKVEISTNVENCCRDDYLKL